MQEHNDSAFMKKCYEAYKLDWMLSHGYTLTEMADIIKGFAIEAIEEDSLSIPTDAGSMDDLAESVRDAFLNRDGFYGQIYVCEEEFLATEFRDAGYMDHLLQMMPGRDENLAAWRKIVGQEDADAMKDKDADDTKMFVVGMAIDGRFYARVYAKDLDSAKNMAVRAYENAYFGELECVDMDVINAEDAEGRQWDYDGGAWT